MLTLNENYTLDISRSVISDYLRCQRKFAYNHLEDNPEPESSSIPMALGTIGHYGLKAGYEELRNFQQQNIELAEEPLITIFLSKANQAMVDMIKAGKYMYRDQEKILPIIPLEHAQEITEIGDAVAHYAHNHIFADYSRYKIISVEEPYNLMVGSVCISGILDLVCEDLSCVEKTLTIFDHKFVGNVKDALAYLPLNIQALTYEAIMWQWAKERGYSNVEFVYNMIRREVPPGFGHRELRRNKDGSIAKNNASTDKEDYLRRAIIFRSRAERESIESNFLRPVASRIYNEAINKNADDNTNVYRLPTVIQTGAESCSGCHHFARCKANLIGRGVPRIGETQ